MSFSSDLYDAWCFRTNTNVPSIANPIKTTRMIRLYVHRMAKAILYEEILVHSIFDWLLVVLCSDATLLEHVLKVTRLPVVFVLDFTFICIKYQLRLWSG